jgi:hypothetical protein
MDDRLWFVVEMYEEALSRVERSFANLEEGEVEWRPLPESNTIALIVRHLAIEAQWHLDSLERGTPMPLHASPELLREIDAVPLDFAANLRELTRSLRRFVELLRGTNEEQLVERSASAYGGRAATRPHFLAYHQAIHLFAHLGQISMIRNLYRRTRGRPGFIPDNPTYPTARG